MDLHPWHGDVSGMYILAISNLGRRAGAAMKFLSHNKYFMQIKIKFFA